MLCFVRLVLDAVRVAGVRQVMATRMTAWMPRCLWHAHQLLYIIKMQSICNNLAAAPIQPLKCTISYIVVHFYTSRKERPQILSISALLHGIEGTADGWQNLKV